MSDICEILVSRTDDAADLPLPRYMSEAAAGMDVCANVRGALEIRPGAIAAVPLGFRIAVPVGFEAQIRARSGLALRHGLTMVNGVGTIDADYRGEVCALVINLGGETFTIARGDRVAQMVINRVERAELRAVAALDGTARGGGGFGHSGISSEPE